MNETYVKKLVEQETINAKIELVQEHIAKAKIEAKFYAKLNSYKNLNEQIKQRLIFEFYNKNENLLVNNNDVKQLNEDFYISTRSKTSISSDGEEMTIPKYIDKESIPGWEGDMETAKILESLGARIVLNAQNAYSYELDVNLYAYKEDIDPKTGLDSGEMRDSDKKDRLWFYPDGRVWSTNALITFGWEYGDIMSSFSEMDDEETKKVKEILNQFNITGNVLKLFNVSRDTTIKLTNKQLWGVIQPEGVKSFPFNGVDQDTWKSNLMYYTGNITNAKMFSFSALYDKQDVETAKAEAEAQISWLDRLQTAMDWLGFLPGIGMAIDGINAMIYLVRYFFSGVTSYLVQGLLSLVAIIPIVGEAIAGSLKFVFKTLPVGIFRFILKGKKRGKAVKEFWSALNGKLGKLTKKLSDGLALIGTKVKQAMNWIRKKFGLKVKPIDEIADGLRHQKKTFTEWAAAEAKKLKGKFGLSRTANYEFKKSEKWYMKFAGNNVKRSWRAIKWPTKKLELVQKTLNKNFAKKAFKNPSKFLADLDPVQAQKLYERTSAQLTRQVKAYEKAGQVIPKQLLNFSNTGIKSADDFVTLSKELNRYKKGTPGFNLRNKVTGDLVSRVSSSKNVGGKLYTEFTDSSWNKMMAAFNNRAAREQVGYGVSSAINPYIGWGKRVDVIYNELADVYETGGKNIPGSGVARNIGLLPENPTVDQKQSIVYALARTGFQEMFPDAYKNVKYLGSEVNPLIDTAAQAAKTAVTDTLGIDSGQLSNYDPEGESGGKFA